MKDYLGIRKFCSLCKYSKMEHEKTVCDNESSKFYKLETSSLVMTGCFKKKDSVIE